MSTKRFLGIIGLAGVMLLSLSAQTIFAKGFDPDRSAGPSSPHTDAVLVS